MGKDALVSKIMFEIRKHPQLKNTVAPAYRVVNSIKLKISLRAVLDDCICRVENVSSNGKRIWHFGYPVQNNLGDLAQGYCIDNWLKENYPDCETIIIENECYYYGFKKLLPLLKERIKSDDLIVFQSGYTFHDKHHDSRMHLDIPKLFPQNKIVFFPQTVLFKDEKEISQYRDSISNRKHLLLMARDDTSFGYINELFSPVKSLCYPDIVTTLIGKYHFDNEREGILFCIRNDAERKFSPDDIENLSKEIDINERKDITDTSFPVDKSNILSSVLETVKKYSEYKLVITDRYHGTIFSLIANTPVVVLPTNDHKVISGADWLSHEYPEFISVAKDTDDAKQLVEKILNITERREIKPFFKTEYYDKLAEYINNNI